MFDALRRAIETMEVPAHADAIVELRRLRDALDSRLTEAEVAYARASVYEVDGFGSMAAFLRHRGRASTAEARREATRLGAWPEVLEAWQAGTVTGTQVEVMAREIPQRHVDRFAVTAAQTCSIVAPLSPDDTRQALERWVELADHLAEREAAEAGVEAPGAPPHREVWLTSRPPGAGPPGGLPLHSTAENARPLPFDPSPTRAPAPDPQEVMARPIVPTGECTRAGTRPRPGRRAHADLVTHRWIVSLS
jgi:hypothetical protein